MNANKNTKLSFPKVFVSEYEKDFIKKFSKKLKIAFGNDWQTEKFFISQYYKLDCLQLRFAHAFYVRKKRNLIQSNGKQISLNIYVQHLATIFKQEEFEKAALAAIYKTIDKALTTQLRVLKGQKNKKRVDVSELIDLKYLKNFLNTNLKN